MDSTVSDPHSDISQISTHLGQQLAWTFAKVTVFTLIYGIFVLLFLHSVMAYFSRNALRKGQHWMFVVTTATFVLTTINEVTLILEISLLIRSAFVEDQNSNPTIRYHKAYNLMTKTGTACSWFNAFQNFICDAVIVWRTYILSPHKQWTLPLFLLLCSVALMFPYLLGQATGATIVPTSWELTLAFASSGLTLATNVVATALIGYVYWTHRKDMSLALGAHRATQAERVLALLTESGVIFCILQSIALIIVHLPDAEEGTPRFYLVAIISAMYYGFTAMYPTAVITLVNSHRTFDQMCSINTFPRSGGHETNRSSAASMQDIVFANPTTTTIATMENHDEVTNVCKETLLISNVL